MDAAKHAARSQDIATKVALLYQRRVKFAQQHFGERMLEAYAANVAGLVKRPVSAAEVWTDCYRYAVDATQRSILFWDTLRERGNNFVEHTRKGLPPVA